MLFILHFRTNQLTLPLNYHAKVQGLLYKLIQGFPDYSDFLHDTGYSDGGKQFKLFCFSDLTGPHHLRGKTIIFPQRFLPAAHSGPYPGGLAVPGADAGAVVPAGQSADLAGTGGDHAIAAGCSAGEAPHGLAHHGVCVIAGRKDPLL